MENPHTPVDPVEPLRAMLKQNEALIDQLRRADPSTFGRGQAGKDRAIAQALKSHAQLEKALQIRTTR